MVAKKRKRILVDMTCSILHHGHIRILKKASKLGDVIVALTSDKEIVKHKNFKSILNFNERKEILLSIKYVKEVIKCNYVITENFIKKNKIDYLVHGSDNKNPVDKKRVIIFNRTKKISSRKIRNNENFQKFF